MKTNSGEKSWKKYPSIRQILACMIELIFPRSEEERLLDSLGPEKVCDMIPCHKIDPYGLIDKAKDSVAIWPYRHPLAHSIIHLIKSGGNRKAAQCAGIAVWKYLEKNIIQTESEARSKIVLVPIPLSLERRRERGYNQCEWIAEAVIERARTIDRKTEITIRTDILTRSHSATRQALKNKAGRQASLTQNIFQTKASSRLGTTILYIIIDDVITTGSTLASAKQALASAGATRVMCLAVAH